MAEVYRATDTKLARTVAVKVILDTHALEEHFLERFLREARMVASLEHPNILPVYDFGEENGVPFLVMPYLPGGSLRERLKAGPVPLLLASSWIAQLADALDAAHAAGVLHRDVKPANVLLGKDDRLFLADFGIAKMLESQTGLTATGVVVGTPIYMAPEQAQGHPASPATDRYALAVVAFEILAGRPPFEGDNALSLMHQHVATPPPMLSMRVAGLPAGSTPPYGLAGAG
jgi:serine/threonine protein kinase